MEEDKAEDRLLASLDRFMEMMSGLMEGEETLRQWRNFRTLLSHSPIDFGKAYGQLARLQRQTVSESRRKPIKHRYQQSNCYNLPRPRKKANSIFQAMSQHESTDRYDTHERQETYNLQDQISSYFGDMQYRSVKNNPGRSDLFVAKDQTFSSILRSWQQYAREENLNQHEHKQLQNCMVLRSSKVQNCHTLLSICFFICLIRQAYQDAACITIWEVYNRLANQTYSRGEDSSSLLKLLGRVLGKKYSQDKVKRIKIFLKSASMDSHMLHMIDRVYSQVVERKDEPKKRRISQTSKQTHQESFVKFSSILPLRVFIARGGVLVSQNYGQGHKISVLKNEGKWAILLDDWHDSQQENADSHKTEQPESIYSLSRYRIDSNSYSRNSQKVTVEQTSSRSRTNRQEIQTEVSNHRKSIHTESKKEHLTSVLVKLASYLNSNNNVIGGLLRPDQGYRPAKSPLTSLTKVYPLQQSISSPRLQFK